MIAKFVIYDVLFFSNIYIYKCLLCLVLHFIIVAIKYIYLYIYNIYILNLYIIYKYIIMNNSFGIYCSSFGFIDQLGL